MLQVAVQGKLGWPGFLARLRMFAVVKNCWLKAAAAMLAGPMLSAAAVAAIPGFNVKVWETEDGLPQSAVLSLLQTRDGYLWAGTLNGVARFDGIQFHTFDDSNTPGLTSSRIMRLFEDSRGNFWIGTETAGAFLFNDGKIKPLDVGRGGPEGQIKSICEDRHGSVWFYTAAGGLCRYYSNRLDVWNEPSNRPSYCRSIVVDEGGLLWVGTDWRLRALGPVTAGELAELPVVYEIAMAKLDFLLGSKRGGFWRLGNGRIQKWRGNQLQADLGAYPWAAGTPVVAACEDAQGNIIVGTHGEGVFWYDADGHYRQFSIELSESRTLALTMDREGCLWVGTNGRGLNRIKRTSFEVLPGTTNSAVQSVVGDPGGGVWIGFNGERVDRWTTNAHASYTNFRATDFLLAGFTNTSFVRSLLIDTEQRMWAGTYGNGLFQLVDGTFRRAPGSGGVPREVMALFQDKAGRIWAGTQRGLAGFESGYWKMATNVPANLAVRALGEGEDGSFWVGTEGGGLHRIAGGRTTVFTRAGGLPSDNITALALEKRGVAWVGTSGGLARWDGTAWTSYAGRLGRDAGGVAYLLEDGEWLWLGSNMGLARVAKKALDDFAAGSSDSVHVRWYGTADGLPTRECTQGSQPAACRTSDGRLWFPTALGLAVLEPSRLRINTNPPPVVIEAVFVDNRLQGTNILRTAPPERVVVPAGKQVLQIDFTSLNLSAPDKVQFRYRLEGHETTSLPTTVRFVRYSKLPPGDYRFHVTAANEDGIWNETGAYLRIRVLPPFWRTWPFLGLSTLVLLGLVVGVVHYVSTQRLQRQLAVMRQQEALERERARIARDLHDQLGANLTQITLLGEMAEADKELPGEVEGHARQICSSARETTRALDEIVWTVNPSNDTLDGLVNYVCKHAQEYLATAGLRYRLEVPSDLPATPISPELRHNVFLVAKESLNNVVKHSGATSAWLRLRWEPGRFVLEIEDNGRGVSDADWNKGRNGLKNMRKRMEDIGGHFEVLRGAEGGALVRLTAPLRPTVEPPRSAPA